MVVLLLLLLSSFLRFLSSRQEREFRFRSVFKIKRIKRRNFFQRRTFDTRTLRRPGNERSKYIFAVSSSTWLASIVRETFNEQ